MNELYYRIITALAPPKDDGGYSTETVIITALLVTVAFAAVLAIGNVAYEQIDVISGE